MLSCEFILDTNHYLLIHSGLRLNEDLTRGSSFKRLLTSEGDKENDEHTDEVFQVGLVENYRFIREVDNKPVDTKVDIWHGMFD